MKKSGPNNTPKKSSKTSKVSARKERVQRIVAYLKKAYPKPKTELQYDTQFQLVAAVMLSAQCTDKAVNKVTRLLFKKYRTVKDFAKADPVTFQKEISSIPFFRNKAKAIVGAAQKIVAEHGARVPRTEEALVELPGIGYKTAHVILGELFGIWEGIATDTHVRRFAIRFDLTDNTDLTKISKDLETLVPKKDWKYINNGLVLYGRYICPAKKHDCKNHPLTAIYPPSETIWPKSK
ncbi:MAG: endonuclease III domain-containing protein [Patescibacteria group bacterium UBA2163]